MAHFVHNIYVPWVVKGGEIESEKRREKHAPPVIPHFMCVVCVVLPYAGHEQLLEWE